MKMTELSLVLDSEDSTIETKKNIRVFIRPLRGNELVDLPTDIVEVCCLYAVCSEEGECLAISSNFQAAHTFAKTNGLLVNTAH